jgi:hypothetical protein
METALPNRVEVFAPGHEKNTVAGVRRFADLSPEITADTADTDNSDIHVDPICFRLLASKDSEPERKEMKVCMSSNTCFSFFGLFPIRPRAISCKRRSEYGRIERSGFIPAPGLPFYRDERCSGTLTAQPFFSLYVSGDAPTPGLYAVTEALPSSVSSTTRKSSRPSLL